MQYSQIPTKVSVIWGASAGGGYITPVPIPSQTSITPGRASFTDGFPPLNFLPVGAGGIPPFGQDMNGILNAITAWTQWQGAGGLTKYDAAFSTSIGGYPFGALLASTTAGTAWLCTADNNTTNPDAGGTNWVQIGSGISAGIPTGTDTGSANVMTVNVTPVPTAYNNGAVFIVQKANAANNGGMTGNINTLGSRTILGPDGAALTAGQWPANYNGILKYDSTLTALILLNPAPAASPSVVQPGTIEFISGTTPPIGRVEANGQSLSRTTYAALWAFAQVSGNLASSQGLKTNGQYGPGDGSTTFTIPDLRGYFLRAFDDGAGVDPGRAFGSTQADAFKSHQHNTIQLPSSQFLTGADGTGPSAAGKAIPSSLTAFTAPIHLTQAVGSTETRPLNIAMLVCIKT